MADALAACPPSRRLAPGAYGPATATPGVTLRPVAFAAATLVAGTAGLPDAAPAFGVALPDGPRHVASGEVAFIGTGPGRWLVLSRGDADALLERLDAAFAASASVFDQSGGLAFFVAAGPQLMATLPRLLALELDGFAAGTAATTVMAHIGVTVWRDADSFTFAVGRSYEAAFLRAFAAAAAEFGMTLNA